MTSWFRLGSAIAAAAAILMPSLPVLAAASAPDGGLPNVFISPSGQPFRANVGEPYPVAVWFKQADANGDGKVDRAEFVADAGAYFKILDLSKDGILDPYEVSMYEHRVAPEILGGRVRLGDAGGAHLWLAQFGSGQTPGYGQGRRSGYDGDVEIDPNGGEPNAPAAHTGLDVSGVGAVPYSLLAEPEPITSADLDLRGYITLANFLKLADIHFTSLDTKDVGYLTLADLPKTDLQKALDRARRGRR
jgi:hypothetical protein